ncbi:MAG: hypothetical protein CSA66_04210 [Proteobacteria bacterium]|nr:MAG: hypothetical protein CSA66_04210 [Pseudomonadota bacterium]
MALADGSEAEEAPPGAWRAGGSGSAAHGPRNGLATGRVIPTHPRPRRALPLGGTVSIEAPPDGSELATSFEGATVRDARPSEARRRFADDEVARNKGLRDKLLADRDELRSPDGLNAQGGEEQEVEAYLDVDEATKSDGSFDEEGTSDDKLEPKAKRRASFGRGLVEVARRIAVEDPRLRVRPDTFLPRVFYFENTYLGGAAAYRERLRRLDESLSEDERPYHLAHGYRQAFDPPARAGLSVSADVDAPYYDGPRRTFLQVGLQGSPRHGWRRPPLDVMIVVDRRAFAQDGDAVIEVIVAALRQLGAADRLGIVVAGQAPTTFMPLSRIERARSFLATRLDGLKAPLSAPADALEAAMGKAGALLAAAADDPSLVPGSQTLLLVTAGDDAASVAGAARAAHALTTQGAVTSVLSLYDGGERGGWWQVANAGYGNYHAQGGDESVGAVIAEELASLARVVARLVRVNVRLGKHARAVRVLGTRVLDAEEVARVKAREVAMDKSLSRAMGITSDRGEDDDGMQTVIPYFYGDDSHVILIELWVDGPGAVADVTVRYKDMVNLDNAVARASVRLDARPRPRSPEALLVQRNVEGAKLAEALQRASHRVKWSDPLGAVRELDRAAALARHTSAVDRRVVRDFRDLVAEQRWRHDEARRAALMESLQLAGERKVGEPAPR